jgi:Cof subfamily protein (haloacid dehalogenase superfamily)
VTDSQRYLFGIDLDGTLLNPVGRVSDRTKAAVQAILQSGHKVAFATGRNYTEARAIFDIIEHQDLAVLVSGAIVVDTRSDQTIYRSAMQPELARSLCQAIERLGFAAVVFQDRFYTGVDYVISTDRHIHGALRSWLNISSQIVSNHSDLSCIDHSHTLRVSTVLDYARAARLKQVLESEFGNKAYVHSILVVSEGVEIIEMFDRHVNKWHGLKQVADHHAIPYDRIIAIGDDMNDLAMIQNAHLGIAMGNARDEIKQVADRVIGSHAEDGLAAFLEEWLNHSDRRNS